MSDTIERKGMTLVIPADDAELRPYFEAAAQGRFILRQCDNCGLLRYPPGPACPWCSGLSSNWVGVAGRGTVYSYEVVEQAIHPGFATEVPYAVVLVELDLQKGIPTEFEAIRILSNLLTSDGRHEDPARVAINAPVDVIFQPIAPGLALPQWTLIEAPPARPLWRLT